MRRADRPARQAIKRRFGCYLLLGHNWANPQATAKSFELIARHVMPHFQGQAQSTLDSAERFRRRAA